MENRAETKYHYANVCTMHLPPLLSKMTWESWTRFREGQQGTIKGMEQLLCGERLSRQGRYRLREEVTEGR